MKSYGFYELNQEAENLDMSVEAVQHWLCEYQRNYSYSRGATQFELWEKFIQNPALDLLCLETAELFEQIAGVHFNVMYKKGFLRK